MPKLAQIKTAIKNSIGALSPANGYATAMTPDKVTVGTQPTNTPQAQQNQAAYPKCSIFRSGNGYSQMPSRRIEVEASFTLIFSLSVPYTVPSGAIVVPLETQVDDLYSDLEAWADRNAQLGGSDLLSLVAIADDQGTSNTEATVVAEILIKYKRNMHLEP